MHEGHELLLTASAYLASKKLVVGITDESYVMKKKLLPELIDPVTDRIRNVKNFVQSVKPSVEVLVESMSDAFGPSVRGNDLQAIVCSSETVKGGEAVSEKRVQMGLSGVTVMAVDFVTHSSHNNVEEFAHEPKLSSSDKRKSLLGSRLKPPLADLVDTVADAYIVGITGGIASGKTSLTAKISQLTNSKSVAFIDCDKLGHSAYEAGSKCFAEVVQEFGREIVSTEDYDFEQIDRRALGNIVFRDPERLERLNQIVWPHIKVKIIQLIEEKRQKNFKLIFIDAAVLFEADWHDLCNDVWTCIIPRDEAIRRIKDRNPHLPESQIVTRIESQISNSERVKRSNFVFCTLWTHDFTLIQTMKALKTLYNEISSFELIEKR